MLLEEILILMSAFSGFLFEFFIYFFAIPYVVSSFILNYCFKIYKYEIPLLKVFMLNIFLFLIYVSIYIFPSHKLFLFITTSDIYFFSVSALAIVLLKKVINDKEFTYSKSFDVCLVSFILNTILVLAVIFI